MIQTEQRLGNRLLKHFKETLTIPLNQLFDDTSDILCLNHPSPDKKNIPINSAAGCNEYFKKIIFFNSSTDVLW